jgi:Tol biopolymer transport system component
VKAGTLEAFLAQPNNNYLTSKFSHDGKKVALSNINSHGNMNLYIGDAKLDTLAAIQLPPSIVVKRSPSWSPNGKTIAFQGRGDKKGNTQNVDSWGVYVYDTETAASTFVASGTNPIFLPDNSIAMLMKDGIYRVTLPDMKVTNVLPVTGGTAGANMKFDVSSDGKKIAWAIPEHNKVYIIDVSSWSPFVGTTTRVLLANAFWPVFSPKGEFVTMEVFDWERDATGKREAVNQRLAIYSLKEKKWTDVVLDLTSFYQEAMFVTDWK